MTDQVVLQLLVLVDGDSSATWNTIHILRNEGLYELHFVDSRLKPISLPASWKFGQDTSLLIEEHVVHFGSQETRNRLVHCFRNIEAIQNARLLEHELQRVLGLSVDLEIERKRKNGQTVPLVVEEMSDSKSFAATFQKIAGTANHGHDEGLAFTSPLRRSIDHSAVFSFPFDSEFTVDLSQEREQSLEVRTAYDRSPARNTGWKPFSGLFLPHKPNKENLPRKIGYLHDLIQPVGSTESLRKSTRRQHLHSTKGKHKPVSGGRRVGSAAPSRIGPAAPTYATWRDLVVDCPISGSSSLVYTRVAFTGPDVTVPANTIGIQLEPNQLFTWKLRTRKFPQAWVDHGLDFNFDPLMSMTAYTCYLASLEGVPIPWLHDKSKVPPAMKARYCKSSALVKAVEKQRHLGARLSLDQVIACCAEDQASSNLALVGSREKDIGLTSKPPRIVASSFRQPSDFIRCRYCNATESKASSRRRELHVHPLIPIDTTMSPVLFCDTCMEAFYSSRKIALEQEYLQGPEEKEGVCACCGGGSPEEYGDLIKCCTIRCPRSFCTGCLDFLMDTDSRAGLNKCSSAWVCPVCSAASSRVIEAMLNSRLDAVIEERDEAVNLLVNKPEPVFAARSFVQVEANGPLKRATKTSNDKAKRQRVTGSVEGEFASPKSEATLTVKEALPPIAEDYRPALYFSNYARSLVQRVREKNTDTEDDCFVCWDGGNLTTCDYHELHPGQPQCTKVYHSECLGFKVPSRKKWCCPRHFCFACGMKAVEYCHFCPTSFCQQHRQEGAKRVKSREQIPRGINEVICDHCEQVMQMALQEALVQKKDLPTFIE